MYTYAIFEPRRVAQAAPSAEPPNPFNWAIKPYAEEYSWNISGSTSVNWSTSKIGFLIDSAYLWLIFNRIGSIPYYFDHSGFILSVHYVKFNSFKVI